MVFDLPFMYGSLAGARSLLDGQIGREVMGNLEKHGIKGMALADNTYRNLRGLVGLLATIPLLVFGNAASAATELKLWHGETTEIRLPNKTLVNPYHGGATTFKEIVERETNGEYLIDIFAGSLYQGEREGIEALLLGAVDFVVTASAPLGAWEPT